MGRGLAAEPPCLRTANPEFIHSTTTTTVVVVVFIVRSTLGLGSMSAVAPLDIIPTTNSQQPIISKSHRLNFAIGYWRLPHAELYL